MLWVLWGLLFEPPEAIIAYSGLRKGGKHSENSFLIKQFMMRQGEGARPTLVDLSVGDVPSP